MIDVVLSPENTAPPVERVWMFVSRDESGRENVCGCVMGELGWQPMITGNPKVFEIFQRLVKELALESCAPGGKTIHLLSFTHREEIEGWR